MKTLGDIFRRNARNYAGHPALIFEGRTITFAELFARTNRLASALWNAGIRKRDRVAMLSMNRPEYVEVWGVGELAGFHIASLNFRLAAPEIEWIVNDSDPQVLIFESQYADLLQSIRPRLREDLRYICIGGAAPAWAADYEAFLAGGDEAGAPSRAEPDDPIGLIYTSGTTGRPKGVIRSNGADLSCAFSQALELGIHPGDKYLLMMPWFHIGARAQQTIAHVHGATVIMHRNFDPGRILEDIENYGVTHMHMAPTLVHDLFEHPEIGKRNLSSIRTIYYAAAPMPVPLLRKGLERLGNVFTQGYGSTEISGLCLQKRDHVLDGPPELTRRIGSIGQAQTDTDVRILDDEWNECPPGTVGEITLSGTGMMDGYWNNHAATSRVMRGGWFRNGDMGYADEDGFIYLVDRKKDMIISGGENIYSREVENAIVLHPAVSEVAVIGVPDERWGESVRALVVLRGGACATEQEIKDHVRSQIAGYKAPKSIVFLDALPRLANGKIDKLNLRENHGQFAPGGDPSDPNLKSAPLSQ
jgi:acyl-CoA synthetase (AMP-forming)/AMP-acid ligase II